MTMQKPLGKSIQSAREAPACPISVPICAILHAVRCIRLYGSKQRAGAGVRNVLTVTNPMTFDGALPIDEALPALTSALRTRNAAVLVAPPGAGKTTRVPLVLADEPWAQGKTLVLEPRRIAARAAADRMAKTLRERTGETVGLRVRFGSKVS